MEGIQLFAPPSTNLNPGWSFTAQNIGTSGSEMMNPASANMFATQRMAFLFSRGRNSSTMAPASGRKRMTERMWFAIFTLLTQVGNSLELFPDVVRNEAQDSRRHH